MTLDHKAPAGPRPAQSSPTRLGSLGTILPPPSSSRTSSLVSNAPMLHATSSNNHSLFSFGRNGETGQTGQPSSSSSAAGRFDFLPSVSFDDLHTSIESASTDYNSTKYPSSAEGSISDSHNMTNRKLPESPIGSQNGGASRVTIPASATRPGRSGSILRRPSMSSRQPSTSSIASTASVAIEASAAAMRHRRQNHYPPVSNASIVAKPPRKSIGPGVTGDSDSMVRTVQKRRPSLLSDRGGDSSRTSIDGGADFTRNLAASRAIKAKSVQPPLRPSQASMAGSTLTPEHNRFSTLTPRSPRPGGSSMTPSSGGKRASIMPGSHNSAHATGLGARTISPTDTRRMKRMSMMPHSSSLEQITNVPPPPIVSHDMRAESRSPSMIPRKASGGGTGTPSSARTTPDLARKSYSSGLSVGSTISYNTVRTSTGSLQPRLPQSSSTSRLPAIKHATVHNPLPADEDEDVPPVPAIPKAYESPKDSPAEHYFSEKRKKPSFTNLDLQTSSNGSISMPIHPEPTKLQRKLSTKKSSYNPSVAADGENKKAQSKKQLQPLRLPPMNLGPLSIPTAAKVAALQEHGGGVDRHLSPPLSRQLPKTPTTPMTASKSSFFSKSVYDDTIELPSLRSSTSVHHARRITPTPPEASSSDSSLDLKELDHKAGLSPFLSSSLPKGEGLAHGFLKRSKTGGDFNTVTGTYFEEKPQAKPAGPRALNTDKPVPKSPPPIPVTDEPQTPSSMSSLRRKLSLSWKRGNSKGSSTNLSDATDKAAAQQSVKEDSMPPPRIPASATLNSLSNAKESSKGSPVSQVGGGYLETRRRKSSAASLNNLVSHDRVKSDTWSSKKEHTVDSATAMPATRNPSVVNRILKPRSSSGTLRNPGPWTAMDLDKDDLAADDEMRKLGSRRKETEFAAKTLDALKKRASPKERVGPHEAIRIAMLNMYERGEIIDYSDIYFCGTQNAHKVVGDLQSDTPNFGYDDERGDYTIVIGDHLSYRYEVVDILGKGSFGQVVRCIDHKLGVLVAVKIIRNKKRFHQQALVEVNILQKLREWDPKNRHSMVNFTQSFYFRGHLCISTELLDMNLYELIKAHSFRGFSLRIIRRFTKQMLSSLLLLKQHKVIHCDLKPENILLRHPLHAEIKVIDFGSSCFESEKVYTYIQSRFYRSPEVILGMTYGLPIDMWSVGCILAELYTGVPIFPGENEQEQLACIMEVFGPPEKHLIEKSTRKKLFFDSMGKPRLTVSSKGRRRRPSSKTLQQVLKCDDEAFVDFLARCLRWDPERRLKPEDAIRHEFITGQKAPAPVPRMPMRDLSPIKRHHTISLPRPLPDPPGLVGKISTSGSLRSGVSPHKAVTGASRRTSGATAATAASMSRRTSAGGATGAPVAAVSSLPRAAGRTASGKQDIAAAGATVAMNRRP